MISYRASLHVLIGGRTRLVLQKHNGPSLCKYRNSNSEPFYSRNRVYYYERYSGVFMDLKSTSQYKPVISFFI